MAVWFSPPGLAAQEQGRDGRKLGLTRIKIARQEEGEREL